MKKEKLLKAIGITFLIVVVLSWLIPTGTVSNGSLTVNGTEPIGVINLFRLPIMTLQTFIQYTIVICAIGALYGVLNKTGVYDNLVRKIAKKFSGKEKMVLIFTIAIYALLGSLTGLSMVLFVTVPFIAGILLVMGYGKITALLSTIGAVLVGETASIFGFSGAGYVKNIFTIKMTDEIVVKIVLFLMLTVLYVFFVTKKAELNKAKGKKDTMEDKIPFLDNDTQNSRRPLPLIVLSVIALIFLFVGCYNWYYGAGVELFNSLHTAIDNIKIANYPIITNLLGGSTAIGYWGNYEISVVIVIYITILGWVYNLSISDVFDGIKKGVKEIFPVALYATLANIVFTIMLSGQGSMLATVADKIGSISKTFKFPVVTLIGMAGSFFYNDFYYVLTNASNVLSTYDAVYYPLIGVITTGVHGILMLILPTSVMLIAGLKYFNISYKEWFKTIWKFLLEAFIILMLVAVIITVLI